MNLFNGNLLAVGSFSSFIRSATFRFSPFHYTTSFRSFHPPKQRTQEKLLLSFKESLCFVPLRHLADTSKHTAFVWRNLQKQSNAFVSAQTPPLHPLQFFSFVQSFHLSFPPHFWNRYSLFFPAICLSHPPLKYNNGISVDENEIVKGNLLNNILKRKRDGRRNISYPKK